jgi:hypothetical protein
MVNVASSSQRFLSLWHTYPTMPHLAKLELETGHTVPLKHLKYARDVPQAFSPVVAAAVDCPPNGRVKGSGKHGPTLNKMENYR